MSELYQLHPSWPITTRSHQACYRVQPNDCSSCIIVLPGCSPCSPHLQVSSYPWTWCLSHYCQLPSVLLSDHSDQEWIHLNTFTPSRHSRSFHEISHIIPFAVTLNLKTADLILKYSSYASEYMKDHIFELQRKMNTEFKQLCSN